MLKRIFLIGIFSIIVLLVAYVIATNTSDEPLTAAQYRSLSTEQFANILETEAEAYTIVNVHIPYVGEIEGTDTHIAYNDLNALKAGLPDKDAPIILYCRSGGMSQQTTRMLVEEGYTEVYDVLGGMNAWQNSGRQLVNRQ